MNVKSILIVDDDLHSREGLKDSLLREGHRVEAASEGWQAIRRMKQHQFDIAIIDLDLRPVLGVAVTGWDLVRILRAFNPAISIILLGAEEDIAVSPQSEQLRLSGILVKPINPSQLKAMIRNLKA